MSDRQTYTTEEVRASLAAEAVIIAAQNDAFRETWGADFTIPGQIVVTQGIVALPFGVQKEIMQKVMCFDAFDEDNDPYETHEFGGFTVQNGETSENVFWKIDL